MRVVCLLFLGAVMCMSAWGQTGIPVASMAHCDNQVLSFLNQYDIPGATFAMAKNGKLVYMRAFGQADLAGQDPTQPYHLFRIASVSKPVTAIAIMKLVEGNQLSLTDKVFGPGGILEAHPYLSQATVTDSRIYNITVQHLLEHTAGWNRDIDCAPNPTSPYPWDFNGCDPIAFPLHVTQLYGLPNPATEAALLRFVMEKGLNFAPGTQYAYSNMGYLALGLVIEAVTGLSYEDYVTTTVLAPLGICDMHLGNNLLANKFPREAEYQGNGYTTLSAYGTGQYVPWEYGGFTVEAMDAHGGWIATARDLVRLLVAVDGFATKPDILSSASVQTMTTPSAQNAYYAKGWQVNSFNNWWHTGALDGTATIWVRSSGGYTWALLLNKRVIDGTANTFWSDLDNLPWNCLSQTTTFPTHDLSLFPETNSHDLVFQGNSGTSTTISWTPGDGDRRMLIARAGTPVAYYPLDGTVYAAQAAFGQGQDLGSGQYVVYSGTGNSVTVTGLLPGQTYYFQLVDFNQRTATGNHPLYRLCDMATGTATTDTRTSIADLQQLGIHFAPNPTADQLQITADPARCDRVELRNLQGQLLQTVLITTHTSYLDLSHLPTQVYMAACFSQARYLGAVRVVKLP